MDWHKKQRLRAIEIILFWHGRLNTSDLIQAFGISRIQASKDIKQYLQSYPGNMYYDLSERAYIKALPMKLHFTQGDIHEYIDHTSRMVTPNENSAFEVLGLHYSPLQPKRIAPVIEAMRSKKAISVLYGSMTTPEGQQRTLYPHSFVDTGFRWHIRAYCVFRQAFRDFNIGRILNVPELLESSLSEADKANDTLWNQQVTLQLCPNPELNAEQKKLIALEFDMKKHFQEKVLYLKTRASLVHYTLQSYQIDSYTLENPAKTQTLVIKNIEEISSYLF